MTASSSTDFTRRRKEMVQRQLRDRDVTDQQVLHAFETVPREEFVPEEHRNRAYEDRALPIGSEQTISQPYMVAIMTQALDVRPDHRVLEVGTGSGYQAAILVEMGARVFTIELHEELLRKARATLDRLGYSRRISYRVGDGSQGWPEEAPFDRIIVTAGAPHVPESLRKQTRDGGRIVIPVGSHQGQTIRVLDRDEQGNWSEEQTVPCVFVPLVGEEGWDEGNDS